MAGIIKVDRVQSDSNLTFQIGSSNVAYMTADGLQMTGPQLSLSGTTIIPAVGQIAFPATQNASADANTLDDYEEGTWTPTIYGTSVTGTTSYTSSTWGRYQKVGSWVTVQGSVVWSSSSGASGSVAIGGLPFVPESIVNGYYTGTLGFYTWGSSSGWTNYWQTMLFVGNTSNALTYYSGSTGMAQTGATVLNSSGGSLYFSGTYKTAN